jgi:hypothetical protein
MKYRALEPITLKTRNEQIIIPAGVLLNLTENQAAQLSGKIIPLDKAPDLPTWCRADCASLDVISDIGAGCVQSLADGSWREEWRHLDLMAACPRWSQ